MDNESSKDDKLEILLQDGSSRPRSLRLEYLRDITNNFSDDHLLGVGGFGKVYKGTCQNGKWIAVKKLEQLMSSVQKPHFENEVYHLMRLKHPNIVRFVGYCYETTNECVFYDGKPVFAENPQKLVCLEYLPNGSLKEHLSDESSGLDWCTRYKIIRGTCLGLHYLHEECKSQLNASIIHLDLKPANILLDDNMVPKIADFGLSKIFDIGKTQTHTTSPAGSIGYMAPEYIYQHKVSTKADIYSLGVVIIEVITGRKFGPFDDETLFCGDSVELVLKNWRNRLEATPTCTSLKTDCQQIEICLQIGLSCTHSRPEKRPTTMEVIEMLKTCESPNCYESDEERLVANQIILEPKELLDIIPHELQFSSEQNKVPCCVKLTNKTHETVAFHFGIIKANNNYHIEPVSGILEAGSTCHVVVTMEKEEGLLSSGSLDCNDELLIRSIVVRDYTLTSKLITTDMFNNMPSNLVNAMKMMVIMYAPAAKPLSPLHTSRDGKQHSASPANLTAGVSFMCNQLAYATLGFGKESLIKHGHSGDLYHSVQKDGTIVVVKRIGSHLTRKGAHKAELDILVNGFERLVPLIGHWIGREGEMVFVYRFLRNGDLSSALHRKSNTEEVGWTSSLDWIKRLKIATGVAEALCYLHQECAPPMVHRDVQASSILLDDNFEVRLGSLSEVCPQQRKGHQNVIKKLLRFSSKEDDQDSSGSASATCSYDVYCFGKVLLELVTGRIGISALNGTATSEFIDNTLRYINIYEEELFTKIIDPTLVIDEDLLKEVWATAVVAKSCLNPRPSRRPPMKYILKALENPLLVEREDDNSTQNARMGDRNIIMEFKECGIIVTRKGRDEYYIDAIGSCVMESDSTRGNLEGILKIATPSAHA